MVYTNDKILACGNARMLYFLEYKFYIFIRKLDLEIQKEFIIYC